MQPVGGISARIYAERLRAEGMGSNQQAVPFCSQDYEALKQQCVESGCLFEDPLFLAQPASLGFKELAPHSSKTRGVEWQRPTVRWNMIHTLHFGHGSVISSLKHTHTHTLKLWLWR